MPLMIFPLLAYNILVFLFGGVAWDAPLAQVAVMSGAVWTLTPADAFVAFSLAMLFASILRAARPLRRGLMDHILPFLVFAACLAEFLLVPQAATSAFALLAAMTLFDTVAGYVVARRTAPRPAPPPQQSEPYLDD